MKRQTTQHKKLFTACISYVVKDLYPEYIRTPAKQSEKGKKINGKWENNSNRHFTEGYPNNQ